MHDAAQMLLLYLTAIKSSGICMHIQLRNAVVYVYNCTYFVVFAAQTKMVNFVFVQ